jgi:hypothetical protein
VPIDVDMTPEEYLLGFGEDSAESFPSDKKPVKEILDTTIQELEQDKLRTFAFSNLYFFKEWYQR